MRPASPDEFDRRHAEHFLGVARRIEALLAHPCAASSHALAEWAVVGSQIFEAQRHALRLATDPRMAAAVQDFADLANLGSHLGNGRWRRWAQDAYHLAGATARAAGNLAKAASDAGDHGAAVAHFGEAIDGYLATGSGDSAAELASMALRAAQAADEWERLRVWTELADGSPLLSDHGRCRVAVARAQLLNRQGQPAAATAEAVRAVEIAARHQCSTCRGFASMAAARLFTAAGDRLAVLESLRESFTAYVQGRRWAAAAEVAYALLGVTLAPDQIGLAGSSDQPNEVADLAERVRAARAALTGGPPDPMDRQAAGLLTWLHATALWHSGQARAAESAYEDTIDQFADAVDPGQRADAYTGLVRCLMLRSRSEAGAEDWPAVGRLYNEAVARAEASGDMDLRVTVGSEIASRLTSMYWGTGDAGLYELISSELAKLIRLAADDQLTPETAALRRRVVSEYTDLAKPDAPK